MVENSNLVSRIPNISKMISSNIAQQREKVTEKMSRTTG